MNRFKITARAAALALLLTATLFTILAHTSALAGNGKGSGFVALSEPEAEMLTFMREEEKLARDVYLEMYDLWGAVVFSNIATSEQQHMDTMKKMIDKYGLPDPALPDIGLFTNPDLQAKYDELLSSGSLSYVDGLYAGATIEEIDMIDIQHAIDITTHLDLITAYQHLLEGSKNHLRAYVGALETQGVTYTPQLISQELFDAIMGL